MATVKNPHTIKVDIRFLEYMVLSLKELRSIVYGKYKNDRDSFRYSMKVEDRIIRQLTMMIQEHKRNVRM